MSIPIAKIHKATGQSYVYYKGRMIYFGKFGSVSADEKYWSWRATLGKKVANDYLISELMVRYEKEGNLSKTAKHFVKVFREELGHFLPMGCEDFGPLALREVRKMLAAKGTRTAETINSMAQTIQRMFMWGVSVQAVTIETATALKTVPPLKKHEVDRQGKGRKAVPQEIVDATLPHLYVHVQNAVLLQLYTGARPNEILSIRKQGIDRNGPNGTWIYRLEHHKTDESGKERWLVFGVKGQKALEDQFKLSEGSEWLFPSPESKTGHYMPNGYMRAVKAGSRMAGVPAWNPYQLRHLRITQVTTDHGLKTAAMLASHESVAITKGYAHMPDLETLKRAV